MDTLVLSSWFRLLRPIADSHRLANTHAGRTLKEAGKIFPASFNFILLIIYPAYSQLDHQTEPLSHPVAAD